jgi:hypothetical protein
VKTPPDKDLVGCGSLGLGNVDILKAFDRVAIGRELNSAHIDISLVRTLLTTTSTQSPFLVAILDRRRFSLGVRARRPPLCLFRNPRAGWQIATALAIRELSFAIIFNDVVHFPD